MPDPVIEPTPPALSPRGRAREELAAALDRASLLLVEELERQAMDPQRDQRERLRASRVLLEMAVMARRTEEVRTIARQKRRRRRSHCRQG